MGIIAGVDEAGRGPLAGPVTAAAVILDPDHRINGLMDSKLLTEKERERLYERIIKKCKAYAVGQAEFNEIDQINIHHATLLAMQRALENLPIKPDKIIIDGLHCPKYDGEMEAVVDADAKIREVSAASIIAKVTRDRQMREYDKLYPGYGFANHKGYSTPEHFEALNRLGISPIHRKSFGPVMELMKTQLVMDILHN